MSTMQNQTPHSIEGINVDKLKDEQLVIDCIINAKTNRSSPSIAPICRVPEMLIMVKGDYEKYYVPKVVSIGPYHFGDKKLELVEKLKPVFTMKLLSNNEEILRSLYKKLDEMVQDMRKFYAENSTTEYCDRDFTKMMLLDCCFILYYIKLISGKDEANSSELNSHQIVFIHQDLFLLENQIPFKVLNEVMKLVEIDGVNMFIQFFCGNILASEKPKRKWLKWFKNVLRTGNNKSSRDEQNLELTDVDHLLHLLHRTLTKDDKVQNDGSKHDRCTFRNVNELMDVGIHFKPSDTMSLAHVEYLQGWWWFKADVELPPINVDDSTKPMLLNLIAYETWTRDASSAWVTSYICLLDSLIDHPGDVKTLRKAGVLENSLGSDEEVAKLFNEIGTDLVPNSLAFMDAKSKIQEHYKSYSNTLISQLKHEYVKSPWAFLALLGALIALGLSVVQTYYSVWSPKSDCDDLCKFLKINHHL